MLLLSRTSSSQDQNYRKYLKKNRTIKGQSIYFLSLYFNDLKCWPHNEVSNKVWSRNSICTLSFLFLFFSFWQNTSNVNQLACITYSLKFHQYLSNVLCTELLFEFFLQKLVLAKGAKVYNIQQLQACGVKYSSLGIVWLSRL